MRLRCECGREFSPLAEEDCPSCGATERFQHIQGWVELRCPCGHVAWREEDAPDNLVCPGCRRVLKRPPDAQIYPERPDPAPWVERNRRSLPSELVVCAAAWVLIFRGATLAAEGAIEFLASSGWRRSSQFDRYVLLGVFVLLLVSHGVRLIRRSTGSRWTTAVLTGLWIWYVLIDPLTVMVVLHRAAYATRDAPVIGPIAVLVPDAFVLGAVLSKDWARGTSGSGAAGSLASILSAMRVGGIGAWLGLIAVLFAAFEFAAVALGLLGL